jgi:hypothetical protein
MPSSPSASRPGDSTIGELVDPRPGNFASPATLAAAEDPHVDVTSESSPGRDRGSATRAAIGRESSNRAVTRLSLHGPTSPAPVSRIQVSAARPLRESRSRSHLVRSGNSHGKPMDTAARGRAAHLLIHAVNDYHSRHGCRYAPPPGRHESRRPPARHAGGCRYGGPANGQEHLGAGARAGPAPIRLSGRPRRDGHGAARSGGAGERSGSGDAGRGASASPICCAP